jgi:haloalkane dehalogenase
VIPPLVAAGFRVLAPDLIGFGRSDKPSNRADHTYARQVEWLREWMIDTLDLRDVTVFGQDWGSLLGLRLVGEHPDRFARVAIGNGGLPTGDERPNEAFTAWQEFSQTTPELPVGRIISGGCATKLAPEIVRGYDAPFPDESFKEGARVFPSLVPTTALDPAHDANVAAWSTLKQWTKPFLTCFSDGDPITKGADKKFVRDVPGTAGQPHTTITGGGHFLQEDCGEQLGQILVAFVGASTNL